MLHTRSSQLFNQAKQIIPGGVNSPVRAFKSVGADPLFIKRQLAAGSMMKTATAISTMSVPGGQ